MEFRIDKCDILVRKKGKRQTNKGIELQKRRITNENKIIKKTSDWYRDLLKSTYSSLLLPSIPQHTHTYIYTPIK